MLRSVSQQVLTTGTSGSVRSSTLWISDTEVREIFRNHRCYYTMNNGVTLKEGNGVFVREQRSKEQTLGYVFRNPINGENWLWVVSKKTRKPFALARVS